LRLVFVAGCLVAGCAEVSGLSGLNVGDAGGLADAATDAGGAGDASTDAAQDVSDGGATIDGPVGLGYCSALDGNTYVFCADFDEGDVTMGFAGGLPASWTAVSSPAPTLATSSYQSAPASGLFTGGQPESEMHSVVGNGTSAVTVRGFVAPTAMGNEPDGVAAVQIDLTHLVALVLLHGTSVTAEIDEVGPNNDGGTTVTTHAAAASLTLNSWYEFVLTVSTTTVSCTLDKSSSSFQRTQAATFSEPNGSIGSDKAGWHVAFDNVLIQRQ
jgi:hypothetical protein